MRRFEEYMAKQPEIAYEAFSELRYGRRSIGAKEIADHYYKGFRGRIDDPIKKSILDHHTELSEEAHKALFKGLPKISWGDALEKVRAGEPLYLWELTLRGRSRRGVPVGGAPDLSIFDGGKPINVVDYKFRLENKIVPQLRDYIQLRVCSWLLSEMNFDTSELYYSLILSKIGCKDCEKLKSEPLNTLLEREYPADKRSLWKCECELGESQAASYLFNPVRLRQTGEIIDHYVKRFLVEEVDSKSNTENGSISLPSWD